MESRQENLYSSQGAGIRGDLEKKIRERTAKVGVIGLGHAGLPLAVEMAKAGFQVTGIDIDGVRTDSVNSGKSYILTVADETLESLVIRESLKATQSLAAVENLDIVGVCVPTPLEKTGLPDFSYLIAAVEAIHNHLHMGHLIILENTTYPQTTREVVLPILEKTGLQSGQDFFLAYSSNGTSNEADTTRNISTVIVGMTSRCTELATLLHEQFVPALLPETAKPAKL